MNAPYYTDPDGAVWVILGIRLSHYVVMAHAGFLLGCVLALGRAPRHAVARPRLAASLLAVYVAALVGARLFHVVFDGAWAYYQTHPGHVIHVWRGGFVLYGGLMGGALALLAASRLLSLPFLRTTDLCAPGAAAGIAVARLGCFSGGCCFGKPTSSFFGIEYRNFALPPRPIGVPLHPAALYEAFGLAVIAVLLSRLGRRPPPVPGRLALLFAVAYAALRAAVEPFRADPRGTLAGLPTSQFLSLVLLPLALALLLARERRYSHRS